MGVKVNRKFLAKPLLGDPVSLSARDHAKEPGLIPIQLHDASPALDQTCFRLKNQLGLSEQRRSFGLWMYFKTIDSNHTGAFSSL
jgi:hypothetical protein